VGDSNRQEAARPSHAAVGSVSGEGSLLTVV
jgi:hypothetical protein